MATITRRKFLQFLGVGVAVAAVPAPSLFKGLFQKDPGDVPVPGYATGFQPHYQYGDYVVLTEDPRDLPRPWLEDVLNLIQEQVSCLIPRRYWGNVKVESKFNESYNRWYVCWKYTPSRWTAQLGQRRELLERSKRLHLS